MKYLTIGLTFLLVQGCGNDKQESADKERKEKTEGMYRTPPPTDRSKDQGF